MIQYLLLLLLIFNCGKCSAEYGSYMINGTKWSLQDIGNHKHYIEFGSSTITHTQYFLQTDKTIVGTCLFYFSPTIPDKFDQSMVGKGTRGKYLIEFSNKTQTFRTFEIVEITGDSMILRHIDDQSKYFAGYDPVWKYKRVLKSKDGKEWE